MHLLCRYLTKKRKSNTSCLVFAFAFWIPNWLVMSKEIWKIKWNYFLLAVFFSRKYFCLICSCSAFIHLLNTCSFSYRILHISSCAWRNIRPERERIGRALTPPGPCLYFSRNHFISFIFPWVSSRPTIYRSSITSYGLFLSWLYLLIEYINSYL